MCFVLNWEQSSSSGTFSVDVILFSSPAVESVFMSSLYVYSRLDTLNVESCQLYSFSMSTVLTSKLLLEEKERERLVECTNTDGNQINSM